MKRIVTILLLTISFLSIYATEGALSGAFSVSATKKVYFSKGNLQYQASTKTWRFAEHQYDYIGSSNANASASYSGWIDVFGFGTSGWSGSGVTCYQPWSKSTVSASYFTHSLTGTNVNADWGMYNPISNGGNMSMMWRCLTASEWDYLLSHHKWCFAKVNGISGFMIIPLDFICPSGVSISYPTTTKTSQYYAFSGSNSFSISQFEKLQSAGVVFFPCGGYRYSDGIRNVGTFGNYWLSDGGSWSRNFWFTNSKVYHTSAAENWAGLQVRLVLNEQEQYTITFNANGGLIPTGGNMGNTPAGHTTTLNVDRTQGTVLTRSRTSDFCSMKEDNPTRDGYIFDGWWTDPTGGTQVYDATGVCINGTTYWDASSKWIGTSDLTVYAHWIPINYTITTSATNGTITGGGEYAANASATLSATPADCYAFVRWSDGNTSNPRTITVTGDATYTAIFEKEQYTISIAPDDATHGTAGVAKQE